MVMWPQVSHNGASPIISPSADCIAIVPASFDLADVIAIAESRFSAGATGLDSRNLTAEATAATCCSATASVRSN